MRAVGYAYPWDVVEPGFLDRARDLRLDEVAVAVGYHSVRAATPWSATTSAVLARHAALYRPLRSEAWKGRALTPGRPAWVANDDSAGAAVGALRRAGVPAAAWVVLTHSSRLGEAHPGLAVRNCLGEAYPWALCPSHPEVQDYARTLTAEALRGLDVGSVVLEACGQLGAVHQCRHEKTDAVWSPAVVRLLSICCCAACAARWNTDADLVRTTLRDEVRRLLTDGDLAQQGTGLPAHLLAELLAGRRSAAAALREGVLAQVPAGTSVRLHGSLDPWATGPNAAVDPTATDGLASVVLQTWDPAAGADAVRAAREALPPEVAVGGYVTAVSARPVPSMTHHVAALREAGASELHLYHLGLAGPARWPDLQAAAAAAHAAPATPPDTSRKVTAPWP